MENILWKYKLTWVVKDVKDKADYEQVQPDLDIAIGGTLVDSRNRCIEEANALGVDCVIVEDDLKNLRKAKNKKETIPLTFEETLLIMEQRMNEIPLCYLSGVAPTDNAFYYNPDKPVSLQKFVVGSLIIIRKGCELRFDPNLKLKEDYDYTLQHITRYGGVIRNDDILATFEHYSNKGGAVDFRTTETEQEAILYLKRKWGALIKDNPRRPNEILLNIKSHRSSP